MVKKNVKYYVLFFLVNFLVLEVRAAAILVDRTTNGNLQVSGGTGGDYVSIVGNGKLNGSITNSDSSNPGHVDIQPNGNYNTSNTNFGTSDSYLDYVLISNNVNASANLTISNDNFYVKSVFLESSTLELNSNVNISNIAIHNGNSDKKAGTNVIINVDYDQNTSFGHYREDLAQNLAIEKIQINDGKNLTLNNYAYADNIELNGSNSKLTVNDNGRIIGTVSGSGTLVINTDYNHSDTKFGNENKQLDKIQVNDNNNLTIEEVEGYKNNVYVNELNLQSSNSSLTIGNNGKIFGTIVGDGKVVINTNYEGGNDTQFGKINDKIGNMEINNGNSLKLTNEAFIDKVNLLGNSSFELNSGGRLNGSIVGAGSVEINTDYTTIDAVNSETKFGNSITDKLSALNVNSTLTLVNAAFVDTLNLSSSSSILNINTGGKINGIINDKTNGSAVVNLNIEYNAANESTTFGTEGNSIGILNINNDVNFTLNNLAYVTNLSINNFSKVSLTAGGGLNGTFSGTGTIDINKNYTATSGTADTTNDIFNTNFGTDTTSINNVNINNGMNLTLENSAYIDNLTIKDGSTLTLQDKAAISGIIKGENAGNSTVRVEGVFNTGSLGNNKQSYFGEANNSISLVDIGNNGALTLTTDSYIDRIEVTSAASITSPTLSLKGNNGSVTLNNFNGITYDDNVNLQVLITLKNTKNETNNEFMEQLYKLSQLINNPGSETDFTVTNNNLYLDIISRAQAEGDKLFIDSSTEIDYFSEASIVYETIFKDLKLETEYNAQNGNTELYLVVKLDRTPTTDNVSEGTITSSNILDSWKFAERTQEENVLISNLQNVTNKQDFFHALTNLSPNVSGLNIKMPTQSIISAIGNIDKRLSYFRMAKFDSKTNNYNIKNLSRYDIKYYDDYFTKPYFENNVWIEGFAGTLHQNTIDNIFGYDVNFYGGTLGYDLRINTNFILGISYTFNQLNGNDTDYDKTSRDKIDGTTNNADLYFMLYNKWNYLTLNLGGAYNKYKQERKIIFYNFDRTAKSEYDGYSYYAGLEYGFNILLSNKDKNNKNKTDQKEKFKKINQELNSYQIGPINNFVMLTPKISLRYNNIIIDDYTETGADAANLIIKTKDYQSLDVNGGLALTLSKSLTKNTTFQTVLNTFVSYNLINDKVELDARYIDDDEIFKVYGFSPPDLTYNLGLSFNFNFFDRVDLGISYNYIFGDEFNGMIGKVTFLLAF